MSSGFISLSGIRNAYHQFRLDTREKIPPSVLGFPNRPFMTDDIVKTDGRSPILLRMLGGLRHIVYGSHYPVLVRHEAGDTVVQLAVIPGVVVVAPESRTISRLGMLGPIRVDFFDRSSYGLIHPHFRPIGKMLPGIAQSFGYTYGKFLPIITTCGTSSHTILLALVSVLFS